MKINRLILLVILLGCVPSAMAIQKINNSPESGEFVLIENNIDNNYYVVSDGFEPLMVGANQMQSQLDLHAAGDLGALSHPGLHSMTPSWRDISDMWLENSPVSFPLLGHACDVRSSTSYCNNGISLTTTTDSKGFYGLINRVEYGGRPYLTGVLSDAFYQYLLQMPTGSNFTTTLNECFSSTAYDASNGERCQNVGTTWLATDITFTKGAHLKLINTSSVDEVFINSDGMPTPADGNTNCHIQTVDGLSGLACKMVNYTLQSNGMSYPGMHIYPSLNNLTLAAGIVDKDMQFSLTGNDWKRVNGQSSYYTFDEMKSADAIYIFLSDNFFKQMVAAGISDIDSRELFNFRIYTLIADTSNSLYNFTSSNILEIKPREFSINISSEDYSDAPSREGYVGRDEPSLDFNYIVTTSGKTAADEVLIKATGPTQQINGRAYCIFSADDGSIKVPFPATLSFTKQDGSINTYDVGCDGSWRDMTDALWLTSAWTDISGEPGVMNKATVKFSVPMNDDISQKTLDKSGWYGDVSASGEIHVQATWRDIN
ncbi:fimbrial adhesin EcpD [Klebsiella aerogenes]